MTGELKQEDLEQVQKLCKEAGIVPVINPANEDLRMKELKRLGMLEKDLEGKGIWSTFFLESLNS